jgi:hypothetical protein
MATVASGKIAEGSALTKLTLVVPSGRDGAVVETAGCRLAHRCKAP